jgi:hypothetical protein
MPSDGGVLDESGARMNSKELGDEAGLRKGEVSCRIFCSFLLYFKKKFPITLPVSCPNFN